MFVVYGAVMAASTVGTNLSTTGTMAVTGVTTLSANLIGTGASFSTNFEAVGYASVGGAFTVTGVTTLSSRLSGTNASLSTNFEAGGYASASRIVIGGPVSSTSAGGTAYTAEFKSPSTTASTSVLFGGSFKGTCLQMRDQNGANVYIRIGTGATASASNSAGSAHFLISTTSCR